MGFVLHGYHYSVYVRIVRIVLAEKGAVWRHVEVDPFAEIVPASYLELNRFGRVPTLIDGDFVLYETTAMTRYIDEVHEGPKLQPSDPRQRARMNQIIAICDSYGYWPMVRQVFSQLVFNAALGAEPDPGVVNEGLAASAKVLGAIDKLAGGGSHLVGDSLSLADLHLGAMVACFTAAPEGASVLSQFDKLNGWWQAFRDRPSLIATDPGLPPAA